MAVRTALAVIMVLGGLAGAACGSGETGAGGGSAATTTVTSSAGATTTTANPSRDACAAIIGDGGPATLLVRVGEVLNLVGPDMSAATLDAVRAMNTELEQVIGSSPDDIGGVLRTIQLPFREAVAAMDAGGSTVVLETGVAQDAVRDLPGTCARAGYQVNK